MVSGPNGANSTGGLNRASGRPQREYFTGGGNPGLSANADPSSIAGFYGKFATLNPASSKAEAPHELEAWNSKVSGQENATVRWPASAMPLSVFIEEDEQGQSDGIWNLLSEWQAASIAPEIDPTQPLVSFQRVYSTEADAAIRILWGKLTIIGRDFETGHTDRQVMPNSGPNGKLTGTITHATVTLIETPTIDAHLNPAQQKARLEATVLHEIGHALGLEHSQSASDVMHYRGWQNRYLSPNDIAALQALYARNGSLLA